MTERQGSEGEKAREKRIRWKKGEGDDGGRGRDIWKLREGEREKEGEGESSGKRDEDRGERNCQTYLNL